jgi:hypothetical protein
MACWSCVGCVSAGHMLMRVCMLGAAATASRLSSLKPLRSDLAAAWIRDCLCLCSPCAVPVSCFLPHACVCAPLSPRTLQSKAGVALQRARDIRRGRLPPQLRHLRGEELEAAVEAALQADVGLTSAAADVRTVSSMVEDIRAARASAHTMIASGRFQDAAGVLGTVQALGQRLLGKLPPARQLLALHAKYHEGGAVRSGGAPPPSDASAAVPPVVVHAWSQELADASYVLLAGGSLHRCLRRCLHCCLRLHHCLCRYLRCVAACAVSLPALCRCLRCVAACAVSLPALRRCLRCVAACAVSLPALRRCLRCVAACAASLPALCRYLRRWLCPCPCTTAPCAESMWGAVAARAFQRGIPFPPHPRPHVLPSECQLDHGRCLEKLGGASFAAAVSGPLRNVLLADDGCVPAWIVRGRCFAAMGCPLLAGLHFEKACVLQKLSVPDVLEAWQDLGADAPALAPSTAATGASGVGTDGGAAPAPPTAFDPAPVVARLLRATRRLLCTFEARALVLLSRYLCTQREGLTDAQAAEVELQYTEALLASCGPHARRQQTVPADASGGSAQAPSSAAAALRRLDLARCLKAHGDAVMKEAYFASASATYRAALAVCKAITVDNSGGTAMGDASVTAARAEVVVQAQALQFACLVNVATCLHRRHVDLGVAVQCCGDAIKLLSDAAGACCAWMTRWLACGWQSCRGGGGRGVGR